MIKYNELTNRLVYDPDTGIFTYKVRVSNMKPGDRAGRPNTNGHIQISINRKRYMAHNLAWFYMTADYPVNYEIDHINGVYDDNRWLNLRKVTRQQNMTNTKQYASNTTGVKGVSVKHDKYYAQIGYNKRKIYLGYYRTIEEAKHAYDTKALELFGNFIRK